MMVRYIVLCKWCDTRLDWRLDMYDYVNEVTRVDIDGWICVYVNEVTCVQIDSWICVCM
jgi:hypothetical protein